MSRLVLDDQITKGLTDYVKCGICFQVLTSDRKPVECDQCRNTLSCTDCISDWLVQNPTCPYCKQQYPMFEEVSPTLLGLLQTLKSQCKYKKRGCQEQLAVHKELARHEANCPFGDKESNEDSKEGGGSSGGGGPANHSQ